MPKKIDLLEELIACERSKMVDLQKRSKLYDKEITRLIDKEQNGPSIKYSVVLKELLACKE